jgi:glycosyltransferase involved in cell wall biosynthesis
LSLEPPVVAELYRLCDLVLLPSHREGFGMPILEAGVVDRPIFTTDVPALEALGEPLESLIKVGETPRALASRIQGWAEKDIAHRLRRRFRRAYVWPAIFSSAIEPLIQDSLSASAERAR